MSIKLMAAAWELEIPSTEKMVLLCLCDFANDGGSNCWPSIATIARKCSKGARSTQMAIRWLREHEYLDIDEAPGKANQYRLNPRRICTPAEYAPRRICTPPPQNLRTTPADSAPKPSVTIKEPPIKNNTRVKKPDSVSDEVWADFLEHRKGKRAPVTATAMKGIIREAEKAGWQLEAALTETMARGWQSFKAEWVKENGNGRQENRGLHPNRDNRDGVAKALDRRLGLDGSAGETGRGNAGGGEVHRQLPAPAASAVR